MTSPPNVILIVLDTLRYDGIEAKHDNKIIMRYFNEFIKDSIYFSNAFSNSPWTIPAHASMFTGLYPRDHDATHITKRVSSKVTMLAETLKKIGYQTIGVCENSWINKNTGLTRGFDVFYEFRAICSNLFFKNISPRIRNKLELPFVYFNRFILDKSKTQLSIENTMRVLRAAGTPFFLFLNLIECHLPYYPSKKIVKRFSSKPKRFYDGWQKKRNQQWMAGDGFSDEEFSVMRTLYKSSLQCIDEYVGNFLDYLELEGLLDNTLLIITSDHGENIGDHGLIDHQFSLHDSLVKVPLIIKYDNNNYINNNLVETRDIYNTILSATNDKKECLLDPSFGRKFIMGEYYEPTFTFTKVIDSEIGRKFRGKTTYIRGHNKKYVYNKRWEEVWECSGEKEEMVDDEETKKLFKYILLSSQK